MTDDEIPCPRAVIDELGRHTRSVYMHRYRNGDAAMCIRSGHTDICVMIGPDDLGDENRVRAAAADLRDAIDRRHAP